MSWRLRYPDSGIHKPGQSDAGSGTTPTLMGRGRVAITDNANPMHVVITGAPGPAPRPGGKRRHRVICSATSSPRAPAPPTTH